MKKTINPLLWCLSGFALAVLIITISYFTGTQSQVKYRTVKQQTIDATFRFMAELAKQKKLGWPIPRSDINSYFGYRRNPIRKYIGGNYSNYHNGIDMKATNSQPVYPMADGTVIAIGKTVVGGKYLIISYDDDLISEYYHLSKIKVNLWDLVVRDDIVAEVGNTGITTGIHFHFSLKYKDIYINPLFWLFYDN